MRKNKLDKKIFSHFFWSYLLILLNLFSFSACNKSASDSTFGVKPDTPPVMTLPSVGANQTVNTNVNTPVNFTINAGNDIQNFTLYYINTTSPADGTVTNCMDFLGTDGETDKTCTYTPPGNWSGTTTFTYKVNNGYHDSPTEATVTIVVTGSNHAPVLSAISNQTVSAGASISTIDVQDVLGGDLDEDGHSLAYSCTFAGGGFGSGTPCTLFLPGSAAFNQSSGIFTWTPNYSAAVSNTPTNYSFTVTASDQQASPLTDSKTFTITVNPATPLLTTVADYLYPTRHVLQGGSISLDVNNIRSGSPGNDNDMTYACTYDAVVDDSVSGGANCSTLPNTAFSFNSTTGAFSWTTDTNAIGLYEIKITGTDSTTQSDDEIFVIDVRLSFAGVTSITNITTSSMQLNWSSHAGAQSYNVYKVNANGSLTYVKSVGTPSTDTVVTGLTNNTTYTYRVRAIDVNGNIDGNNVNAAGTTGTPGSFSIATLAATEGAAAVTPTLNCSDSYGNTPSYSITSQSDTDVNCSLLTSPDRVSCTPNYKTGHSGWSSTVSVQCDINGSTFVASFSTNIADANRAPTLGAISNQTVSENTAITLVNPVETLGTSATDDTDIDGDALLYSCTFSGGGFSAGTACTSLPGSVTFTASTGILNWTPNYSAAVGEADTAYSVTIVGSDQQSTPLTDSKTFSLTVTNVNRAPVLGTISNQTVTEGQAISQINTVDSSGASATDDIDADGHTLSYTCTFSGGGFSAGTDCTSLPGTAAFNTSTGVLDWTPSLTAAVGGSATAYSLTIIGSDLQASPLTDSKNFTITINNMAASFTAISALAVAENATGSTATLACSDGSGGTPTFSILSQTDSDANCSLVGPVYVVQCSPTYKTGHSAWSSTVTVQCAINDSATTRTLTVNVSDTNRSPSLSSFSNQTVAENATTGAVNPSEVLGTSASDDTDIDGDALLYNCTFSGGGFAAGTSCASLPGSYSLNSSTGVFTFTPNYSAAVSEANTDYTITLTGEDQQTSALSDSQSFTVTVTNVNRAPNLGTISNQTVAEGSAITQVNLIDTLGTSATDDLDIDGNALSYTCTFSGGGHAAGTACTSLPGTASFNSSTGVLDWTPSLTAAVSGSTTVYTVSVIGSDQQSPALTDSKSFTLTVTNTNPTFAAISTLSVAENATAATASLSCDDGSGNTPTYSITAQTDTDSTCTLTGTPKVVSCSPSYKTGHSTWTSTVTVQCDMNDATASRSFTVSVSDTNRGPTLGSISNQTVSVGSAITAINAVETTGSSATDDSDADNDALTYSCTFTGGSYGSATNCSSLPGTVSFTASTGALTYTPSAAAAPLSNTVYSISIVGSDGQSTPLTDTASFSITVNTTNKLVLAGSATTAGVCTAITLTLKDASNTNYNSPATFTATIGGLGSAVMYTSNTCATTLTNPQISSGSATTTFYIKDTVAETLSMTADYANLTQGTLSLSVAAAAADYLTIIAGNAQTGALNSRATTNLKVKVTDQYGNGKSGVSIAFMVMRGNGVALQPLVTSDASGFAETQYRFSSSDTVNKILATRLTTVLPDLASSGRARVTFTLTTVNATGLVNYSARLPSSTAPYNLSVADLNGDGKKDIVTVNNTGNKFSVFMGRTNGTFVNPVTYTTGAAPRGLELGDIDNDGDLDVVYANGTDNNIGVHTNNGSGVFSAATTYATTAAGSPIFVAIDDFNNDGFKDIAVTNNAVANIDIFINNGSGGFAAGTGLTSGATQNRNIIATDLNNDGKKDLVMANYNSANLRVFIGNGNGTFAAAVAYAQSSNPYGVRAADVNADGKMDIISTSYGLDRIAINLGNGDGTLAARDEYLTGTNPSNIQITDYNGDGKLDIATANNSSNTITMYTGIGDGTFDSRNDISVGVSGATSTILGFAWTDVTGDSTPEFIAGAYSMNDVLILQNVSGNTYRSKYLAYTTDANPKVVLANDFNNDNVMDIASDTYTDFTVNVRNGTGSGGVMGAVSSYITGSNPQVMKYGDFNNDGYLDLVFTNYTSNTFSILKGKSDGTFYSKVNYSTSVAPYGIAAGDLNRDGKLDVVVANLTTATVGVFLGNGDGTFAAQVSYATASQPRHVELGDFNNDGILDIAVSEYNAAKVGIFIGSGTGTFGARTDYTVGTNPMGVAIGDMNADGNVDLYVVNYTSGTLSYLRGNGNGTFQAKVDTTLTGLTNPYDITVADMNGDGNLDLVTAIYTTGGTAINLGNGDGTIQSYVFLWARGTLSGLTVADMNNDSIADIVTASYGSNYVEILTGR